MTTPVRLRLSRAKGFDLQAHSRAVNGLPAVNVARPSKWGNPYREDDVRYCPSTLRRIGVIGRAEAVERFRRSLRPEDGVAIQRELRGRNLACWCADEPCHASVLIDIANRPMCEAVAPGPSEMGASV